MIPSVLLLSTRTVGGRISRWLSEEVPPPRTPTRGGLQTGVLEKLNSEMEVKSDTEGVTRSQQQWCVTAGAALGVV